MREGWKAVKFGEVVEFSPKIKMVKGNKYPFIPMELIDGGFKYVKPIEEKELVGGGAKFEEGDTLFARITPCLQNGKIAQAKNLKNKPGFGSTEYFIFRGIPNVTDNDYVFYLSQMKEFRDNAINSMVGASGRQRADAGHVKSFVFNLPPLETQKKIASILSGYDDLIENNLKRIKILEEMAQQTYEEWFVRMRFPGHESATINSETGLPEGWEKVKLGDLGEYLNGFAFKPGDFEKKGFPIIKIKEMKAGLSTDTPRYSGSRVADKYFVETGDILFSWSATLDVVIWFEEKGYVNQHLFKVTPNEYYSRAFVFFSIKESLKIFDGLTTGATMKHIKRKELDFVIINKPSVEIMEVFRNKVDPMITAILNLQNQNQRLREARDILLPRLMMGMIEV